MNAATPFPTLIDGAERELKILFAHAPVGIAKCSHLGMITMMNPAMEQILGGPVPASSFLGELIGPGEGSETQLLLRRMMEGERTSFQVERAVPGACDTGSPVKWTAWRVEGSNGEPPSGMVMAEDTKLNRRAERRLRQAEKFESVGRMAGGIAHDFNNLVTGVLLYSDLLLAEMDPGTRLRGYVEEIRAAGIQAADVVRQLLAAARPRESSAHALSLNTVLEGMRDLLGRLVGASGTLQFSLDPNLGFVRMPPAEAQQILLNLVLNARDAIADGGRISIETANCRCRSCPTMGEIPRMMRV